MRFTSEKFGMVSPAEFIPILEETGLYYSCWLMDDEGGYGKNAVKQEE